MPPTTIILLVDDEFLIADMVCDALTDCGFEVVIAYDAAEAVALLAENSVDALVTDINMGAGADGWEVARCARCGTPGMPVVYTTGGAAHEFAVQGVADSILVTKPFATAAIVDALIRLLGEQSTRH